MLGDLSGQSLLVLRLGCKWCSVARRWPFIASSASEMQAFAEGTFRLLPTTYGGPKNNAIPNERRINLPPTFNAVSTRHWPVFSDKRGSFTLPPTSRRSEIVQKCRALHFCICVECLVMLLA